MTLLGKPITTFVLVAFLGVAPAEAGAPKEYRIVVDAGSSGSRLYLYEVRTGPYPEIQQVMSFKGIPGDEGIDEFLDNAGGVNRDTGLEGVGKAVITPLLEKAIPALAERGAKPENVTVDFLATAGMRSAMKPVGKHDPDAAQALYDQIRKSIVAEGFAAGEVRTTDGSAEEGLWTWIDVNDRYRDAFSKGNAPVGVVEVGGSSMQISFPTLAAVDPAANVYSVSINGRSFNVFAKTYLGLGQDDARKAMRVMDPPADGGARCFPTGMMTEDDIGDVIGGTRVRINGTARYDAKACGASYASLLKEHFKATGQPDIAGSEVPFYGIAAIRYAFEEMNATPQLPSPGGFAEAISRNCATPDAVRNFNMRKGFSQQICSSATYVWELLYGAEGLFSGNASQFKTAVTDQISIVPGVEGTISWTRGYLLQKFGR